MLRGEDVFEERRFSGRSRTQEEKQREAPDRFMARIFVSARSHYMATEYLQPANKLRLRTLPKAATNVHRCHITPRKDAAVLRVLEHRFHGRAHADEPGLRFDNDQIVGMAVGNPERLDGGGRPKDGAQHDADELNQREWKMEQRLLRDADLFIDRITSRFQPLAYPPHSAAAVVSHRKIDKKRLAGARPVNPIEDSPLVQLDEIG